MAFKPLLLCALVGLAFGCQLSPDQQLVGAWSADRRLCQVPDLTEYDQQHKFENGIYASQLKLSADHTFVLTGLRQLGGKWSFKDGTLTLKPAPDSHLATWQVVTAIRELTVAPDFTQMKITIPTHVGDIVIVLDQDGVGYHLGMAELAYRLLSADEVASGLAEIPGWSQDDHEVVRTYEFGSYLEGVEFAVKVAKAAEALDHHPDMLIGYRKVTIRVSTHSVGGLSQYDFELARRIDGVG